MHAPAAIVIVLSARRLETMSIVPKTILLAAVLTLVSPVVTPARDQGLKREIVAATYPEGTTVKVSLAASPHLAEAFGEAKVRRRRGVTDLEIDLQQMQPAMMFGGDYNTYVLWVVSPEGLIYNTGEIIVNGAKAKQKVTTPLAGFGIMVTAEPHFLVAKPSPFVVLTSTGDGLAQQQGIAAKPFGYSDFAGPYKFEKANLVGPVEIKGQMRSGRHQANIAVRFAEESGAQEWAPKVFKQARAALSETLQGFASGLEEKDLTVQVNRTVRLAVQAKRLAEERRAAAQLADERQSARETIARLQREKADAEARVEQFRLAAEQAGATAEKTAQRLREIEQQMLAANQAADQLAREKATAERAARAAENQAAGFYARMHDALEQLAEIRESERGLVVNLPGVLFASNSSRLQPSAREVLSRIAGVLLVAPEYRLAIEGHTDSTGRTAANQKLSEKRAAAVANYLVKCGISAATISIRGYGESRPIASNRNPAGRKKNRRVEIVIEGLTR